MGICSFAQTFPLRKLKLGDIIKKVGIVFIIGDKNNSAESFWKKGYGEKNLFSKSFFPHKTVLQQILFYGNISFFQ